MGLQTCHSSSIQDNALSKEGDSARGRAALRVGSEDGGHFGCLPSSTWVGPQTQALDKVAVSQPTTDVLC